MKRLFLIISTIVLSCAFISVRAQDSSYQSTAPEDSPVYHTTDYIFYKENGIKWNKILKNGLTMGGTGFYFNIKQDTSVITNAAFSTNDYARIKYDSNRKLYHIVALQETANQVCINMSIDDSFCDSIIIKKIKPKTSNNSDELNKRIKSLESDVLQQTNQIDSLHRYIQAQEEKIEQLTFKNLDLSNDLECLLTEKSNYLGEEIKKGRMMMITIIIVITIIF